jgi:hypothetical protein
LRVLRARLQPGQQRAQIKAGAEVRPVRGQHQRMHRLVALQLVDLPDQGGQVIGLQPVGRVGAVQFNQRYAFGGATEHG